MKMSQAPDDFVAELLRAQTAALMKRWLKKLSTNLYSVTPEEIAGLREEDAVVIVDAATRLIKDLRHLVEELEHNKHGEEVG
jgi:hypothetical protein